jgi:flavin reductase (DIM6/NTAB) family NADH-FMN oxidoreductase RutF
MRKELPDSEARRLLNPGPVTIITTRWNVMTNAMAAVWTVPLSTEPPLVGVCVHPSRHTFDMLRYSEEFAINIPSRQLLNHTQYTGQTTGRDINKIEATGLPAFPGSRVGAPLLEGCLGWIECGLEDVLTVGDHSLFVGRVLKVWVEEDAFDEVWLLDDDDVRPLHYLGATSYALLGERLEAHVRTTAEAALEGESAEEREEREEREARERELAEKDPERPPDEEP